jgi:2-polyprenyl-3-methyl-5-hydroxy-6-metoxy-1,4-benzoquinol methylase
MEQKASYYDEVVKNHPVYRGHYTAYRKWFPLLLLVTDRLIYNKHQAILDLGCGAGHLAHLMYDYGFLNYKGIDFSKEMLKAADTRGLPFDFVLADLNEFDFNTIDYDTIVATEFIEHVDNDLSILSKIRSGAKVLLTTTNEPGKEHVRTFPNEQSVYDRYSHLFSYIGVTSFRNMMCQWGWQVFYVIEGIRG